MTGILKLLGDFKFQNWKKSELTELFEARDDN